MSEKRNIPQHVAIIMDGNGRWAKQRGKERVEGHIEGVQRLRDAIKASARLGVRYLTVYAFSTENWGRPEAEVNAIMELFCKSVINESPELQRQGVQVKVMGDRAGFSEKVLSYIERIFSHRRRISPTTSSRAASADHALSGCLYPASRAALTGSA